MAKFNNDRKQSKMTKTLEVGTEFLYQDNGIAVLAKKATVTRRTTKTVTFETIEDRSLSRAIIGDHVADIDIKIRKNIIKFNDGNETVKGLISYC